MKRPVSVRALVGLFATVFGLVGCSDPYATTAKLDARPANSATEKNLLEIHAELVGVHPGSLTYKWFSEFGECVPQESESPTTVFRFGTYTTTDKVSLEVWQTGKRIAQSQLQVELADIRRAKPRPAPVVQIEITKVPPFDPDDLLQKRLPIAGKVTGDVNPNWLVVVYERRGMDVWYMQPNIYTKHKLRSDNAWSTWTRSGSTYAALVVKPDYVAPEITGVLPEPGGGVLARVVVEGAKQ